MIAGFGAPAGDFRSGLLDLPELQLDRVDRPKISTATRNRLLS